MDDIIKYIDQINPLVTQINEASQEQSAGISQITVAMADIDKAGHINAARVSCTKNTSQALHEKGHHLKSQVSLFQLKG